MQDGATPPSRSLLRAEPPRATHRRGGGNCFLISVLFIHTIDSKVFKPKILCRNWPPCVFKHMTGWRTCGTMRGTLLYYGGQASMSYRTRFAAGCLTSTPRRSLLWLTGIVIILLSCCPWTFVRNKSLHFGVFDVGGGRKLILSTFRVVR